MIARRPEAIGAENLTMEDIRLCKILITQNDYTEAVAQELRTKRGFMKKLVIN